MADAEPWWTPQPEAEPVEIPVVAAPGEWLVENGDTVTLGDAGKVHWMVESFESVEERTFMDAAAVQRVHDITLVSGMTGRHKYGVSMSEITLFKKVDET